VFVGVKVGVMLSVGVTVGVIVNVGVILGVGVGVGQIPNIDEIIDIWELTSIQLYVILDIGSTPGLVL
jgi:hypothetical protein